MQRSRRKFLQNALASGTIATVGTALAGAPLIAADSKAKRYRTVLVGTGWWGTNILREAIASGSCQVVGLVDVDQTQLDKCIKELGGMTADAPRRYTDYRECLEKEHPEIVINATPDHWHPLITIAAVQAGAHVYVEKPIGHTIREGRAMVNAARHANRVVQVGTHRRVSPHNLAGLEFLRSGKVGKIGMVRAFVHYPGGPEQATPNAEPPKTIDWDMWCGPAPLRPYNPAIHPKGFRNFLDYGNGTLADWGIHWMDQILWWTEEKFPKKISSTGGRFIKGPVVNTPEAQTSDAPDTQVAQFEFESFTCVWEQRNYAFNKAEKHNIGVYFYGTEGTFHMGWEDGCTFYPMFSESSFHVAPQLNQPDGQNIKELFADFLRAIETGSRPVSDIEIAHRSTNMSLLGMLSLKHGRSIEWNGETEQIVGDAEANVLLSRPYRAPWQYPTA